MIEVPNRYIYSNFTVTPTGFMATATPNPQIKLTSGQKLLLNIFKNATTAEEKKLFCELFNKK